MTDLSHRRTTTVIAGADPFGADLKSSVLGHLATVPDVQIQDLGSSNYYSIAQQVAQELTNHQEKQQQHDDGKKIEENRFIGLLVCGTGVGVSIFANKYPGIYAATCLTADEAVNARSISDANVLCLSGMRTDEGTAIEIVKTFLKTEFKSPCPASGCEAWPEDVQKFLEGSVEEMAQIGKENGNIETSIPCFICSLAKSRTEQEFTPVDIMPGGSMKILRETPTSAIVRFKAGSVEPAHHHTFGHDLVVTKGSKRVWNLTKGENYDLTVGDYLFTPAGDVHRVKYFEDTEFFIKWDGHWDLFLDEDLSEANRAIDAETSKGVDGNNA